MGISMNSKWFACGAMLLGSSFGRAAAAGDDRADVERTFRSIESALAAHDVEAVLAAYDPGNAALVARTRGLAQSWAGLSNARATFRVGSVASSADEATAVVLRTATYDEHGRDHVDAQWETVKLRRAAGSWRIAAEDERDVVRATHVDLRAELSPESGTMRGTAAERIEIAADGEDALLVDLNRGLAVKSIADEKGGAVPYERTADLVVVPEPRGLRAGDVLTLNVEFEGSLFNESKEQGFSQVSIAPAGSFASWVTHWYPRPSGNGSRATGRIVYVVPPDVTVASSGRLVERKIEDGRERQTFAVDRPLDFSFAAARYFHREETIDGVPVGVYLLHGGDAKADLYIKECARALAHEQKLYGSYPFDGYAVVEIPSDATGSLGGSSEQGMNLFPAGVLPDDEFPLLLIAHEIGHSWWGNLVKSADGAIVSEGLAQTSAAMCLLEFQGERALRRYMKEGVSSYPQSAAMYFARFASQPGADYPLGAATTGSDAASALHDLADTKGVFVYEMLRERIGHEAFVAGLRAVARDFAGKAAGLAELRAAWEKASGDDLRSFFEQWFQRRGAPELVLHHESRRATKGFVTSGTVEQIGDAYDVSVEISAAAAGRKETKVVAVSGRSTDFSLVTAFEPESVVLDPQYKVLRWTPAIRNAGLLAEGARLAAAGRDGEAIAKLEDYVSKAPDGLDGRFRLGACCEQSGKLDRAAQCFQFVLDRAALFDVYEAAVGRSQLHLARVLDLQGRRDDAVAAYRRALELPDDSGLHADARAGLDAPFRAKPRTPPPAADVLARYVGSYGNGGGMEVRVATSASGVLTIAPTQGPSGSLEWIAGSRFRVIENTAVVVEFVGAPDVTGLDLQIGGATIHLQRETSH
jgi:tetratricopeptide (TPR) repeat protein